MTVDQRLTRRRSGLYPDLESFEVAPRARLEPVRLRRVDLATPELTACVEAFGFLVVIWMTPLSSWMLIVWERRHRGRSVVIGGISRWEYLGVSQTGVFVRVDIEQISLEKL
jgi:hypothetical protein